MTEMIHMDSSPSCLPMLILMVLTWVVLIAVVLFLITAVRGVWG